MSVDVTLCQHLEWDSTFFGKRIARVAGDRLTEQSADRLKQECVANGIDCVYLLADAADAQTIRVAERIGFDLIDIRVTLERRAGRPAELPPLPHHSIRLFGRDDIPALRALARTAHHDSRFYHDRHFLHERCDELFDQWMLGCCTGDADAVLVAERDNAVCGYTSCHVRPEGYGQLGLVAVSASEQGVGIGARLVNAAVDWFHQQPGVPRVVVVTQGRNVPAQRLYQRCGFVTASVQLWYHGWFLDAGDSVPHD
jgi:dTDP-4-amino-4,6-dideoxy-D-galactose acyltransferase